jgi:hypothetical protein
MEMSHLETAALRLAIARDEPAVRSAIDRFRVTVDEAELMVRLPHRTTPCLDTLLVFCSLNGEAWIMMSSNKSHSTTPLYFFRVLALQSLCNRFAIALRSHFNRFAIALLRYRFATALLCNRFVIASLCYRFVSLRHRFAIV